MKHVLTILSILFCLKVVAQDFSNPDSSQFNFIDQNGLKQGHWIYTNAEKQLPGYRDDQLVEEGYFKDNLRVGVWKKYYENGNLEFELTFVGNRPSGYAIFYYTNGKVSEEGVWKNNRWVGEYKYYHENGKLKYEWKYNASGKREGVQKYFYENGQLMIIGSWNEGKEAWELKEFFSNGDIKAVKYFNTGSNLEESTKI
jgi:antitoxin component YwqK of YwqJK toxin-antitoxin module